VDCTNKTIGAIGLDSLIEGISSVYANHDRSRSLWDIWSHALHHGAAVAEEIRKHGEVVAIDGKLRQELADLTLWFFTMLVKLRGPIGSADPGMPPQDSLVRISVGPSRLMWNRYPGVCPWCFCLQYPTERDDAANASGPGSCRCDELNISAVPKVKMEIRKRAERMRRKAEACRESMPRSLDEWQALIRAIYRSRLTKLSTTDVTLHLLEEMGEVSDGLIRMYTYSKKDHVEKEIFARQIRLEDELADTLSWIFSLLECLGKGNASGESILMSAILWAQYGSNDKRCLFCRHCGDPVCSCPVRLISDREDVAELRSSIATG